MISLAVLVIVAVAGGLAFLFFGWASRGTRLEEGRKWVAGLPDLLMYASMIDDGIMLLQDGGMMATWRYAGPDLGSATLESAVNTDLPGEVKAVVRQNVYDTATGGYLLIPQGSRLIGQYDNRVSYGQSRTIVIWTRLIFPDGSSVDLDGMIGHDAAGAAGFHDRVDNHFVRLVSMALMLSSFTAGIEMSQPQSNSVDGVLSPSQQATQALGQQFGQLGIEVSRKNLNIQPTVNVRVGYRFNVRVKRDIAFAEPVRKLAGVLG